MYGRIFGFQRLARWPKWTPDSTNSFTRVVDTIKLLTWHTGYVPERAATVANRVRASGVGKGLGLRKLRNTKTRAVRSN